uniref:Apolipoprotein L6 n=1 Tax=Canis lupus familiaris TaxID=9615 RepID=A0A8C0MLP7_CANLF
MGTARSVLGPQEPLDNQAETRCSRDQEGILLREGMQQQDRDLSAEEIRFLEEYPIIKEEMEANIRKLHALADHIDATHRTQIKTNMVTSSVAVVSGAMNFLGLALAPVTAGGSLMLSAAGKVLGTAATTTGIVTNVVEHLQNQDIQAQVENAVCAMTVRKVAYDYRSKIKDVKRTIHALQIARERPRLVTAAKRLMTTGQVSARRSRQVRRAFKGTTLLMTRSARLMGSVMAGLSLHGDLTTLLRNWKQLKEGASSTLAEELRAEAWELETKLTELSRLYESLWQKKLLQEQRPGNSFFLFYFIFYSLSFSFFYFFFFHRSSS